MTILATSSKLGNTPRIIIVASYDCIVLSKQRFGTVQGREKIKLLELFTTMGFDVLLSDVDTLW